MAREPYPVLHYYVPKFFLSIDENKKKGHSILLMIKECDTKEAAKKVLNENNFIITEINDQEELTLKIYQGSTLDNRVVTDDLIRGRIFFLISPLREDIWDLPIARQQSITQKVKENLLYSLTSIHSQPINNIKALKYVISKKSLQHEGSAYFAPIKSTKILKFTSYRHRMSQ